MLLHRPHTRSKSPHQWNKARCIFHEQGQHEEKGVDPAREIDNSICKESHALALSHWHTKKSVPCWTLLPMNMLVSIISPTETFWISKISHSPRRRKYLTPVPVHACTNKHTITDYKYEQIDRPSKSRSRTIFNLLFFVLSPSWNKNIIRLVAPTPAISSIQDGNDEEELVQTCARTRH